MSRRKIYITLIAILIIVSLVFYFNVVKAPKTLDINNIPNYTNQENEESVFINKYIKENIINLASNKPVLGGNWYVVSILVDPAQNAGTVVYEDGHIQSNAKFTYEFRNGNITITSFSLMD